MEGSSIAFLLEFGLFFGGVLVFAFWQFHSLRKLDKADEDKKKAEEEALQDQ